MDSDAPDGDDDRSHIESIASDEHVIHAIHRAVAEVVDEYPADVVSDAIDPFGPLYDVVEAGALDQLVTESGGEIRVNFRYAGCEITVFGDSHVIVRRRA